MYMRRYVHACIIKPVCLHNGTTVNSWNSFLCLFYQISSNNDSPSDVCYVK